jgi:hypothetical protein
MKPNSIYASYATSLLWIALLVAVAIGVAVIAELVFVDFVHGNPHRTQANAAVMILLAPIVGVIAFSMTILVFALPQCLQAALTDVLLRRLNRRGLFGVLLALPVTAALAWYCFDYFTPKDYFSLGINEGPDWTPYQHGLTLQRYLIMFATQTPITLFSVLYCDATICNRSKKWIIIGAFLFAVVVGGIYGLWRAQVQYQFL